MKHNVRYILVLCYFVAAPFVHPIDLNKPLPSEPTVVASPVVATSIPPLNPFDLAIPIELPVLGRFKMLPFTDSTKEPVVSGFKVKFADATKSLDLGALVIDDAEISIIDGKPGITGHAVIFGKDARLGLKKIVPGGKGERLKSLIVGLTFAEGGPTLELIPGLPFALNEAQLEFVANQPTKFNALVTLAGQPVELSISLSPDVVNGVIELPKTPLATMIPQLADIPFLNSGKLNQARLEINNIWAKKLPSGERPTVEARLMGVVDFPKEAVVVTAATPPAPAPAVNAEQKTVAPTPSASTATQFADLIEVAGTTVTEKTAALTQADVQKLQASDDTHAYFLCNALVTKQGVVGELRAQRFELPPVGIIDQAVIALDTQKKQPDFMLKGTMHFNVADVGDLGVEVSSTITKQGIAFSGKLLKEFAYAGIEIKNFLVGFNTQQQAAELIGDIFLPVFSDVSLQSHLVLMPDPKVPGQTIINFFTKSSSKELRPFDGVPGLEHFYVKDFDAGVQVTKAGATLTKSLYVNGDFYIAGLPLKSIMKFVENEAHEKGIYINAPFTKDKKLSDFFPDLKGPIFDGLVFKEASFLASTINYVDINPTTQEKKEIPKGLAFLAKVPLQGTLKPVGDFLGSSDQLFTLYGKLFPNNIRLSELGFELSQGYPQPDKAVSLGETAVVIKGEPSFGAKTTVIFRPSEDEELALKGAIDFVPMSVNVKAQLDGLWEEPFGLPKTSIGNLVLGVGMQYGSPGVPTSFEGGGALKIGDFAAKAYFKADAAIKDIGVKGSVEEATSLSQLVTKVLKGAFDLNIGELKIPDPELKKLMVEIAAKDLVIGQELIRQGLSFKAEIPVLGTTAYIDIMVRPPSLGGDSGFKIFGALDPVSLAGGLLTIGKSSQEFGGRCFVPTNVKPCSVPDMTEIKKAGEEFAVGKPENNQARVDIELTLQRQNFLISGAVNIANLFSGDTCMSVDRDGLNFMLETGMKTNGKVIMWEGKPLFLARVLATSSGGIVSPQFELSIDFMQNLQQYIKSKANEAFDAAQQKVVDDLNSAQREIDKIEGVIDQAEAKINEAEEQLESARKNLEDITKARDESNAAFNKAQAQVDSLNGQISSLENWYNALPEY